MKKYELTDETMTTADGTVLHRIRAMRDVDVYIDAGDLGGWIEKEENLSQDGNAWVYDSAKVYGDARASGNAIVCGDARVYGHAVVCGNAEVRECAEVRENARVYNDAEVHGYARVCGDARVYGYAHVCGDARIGGDARVSGNTRVCGKAIINYTSDYLSIGPIGSRNGITTFYKERDGIGVACGCYAGSLDEFRARVVKKHGENRHAHDYLDAAVYAAKKLRNIEKNAENKGGMTP